MGVGCDCRLASILLIVRVQISAAAYSCSLIGHLMSMCRQVRADWSVDITWYSWTILACWLVSWQLVLLADWLVDQRVDSSSYKIGQLRLGSFQSTRDWFHQFFTSHSLELLDPAKKRRKQQTALFVWVPCDLKQLFWKQTIWSMRDKYVLFHMNNNRACLQSPQLDHSRYLYVCSNMHTEKNISREIITISNIDICDKLKRHFLFQLPHFRISHLH